MDNKRKLSGPVLGKGPGKLRKVSLNAFDADEGNDADVQDASAQRTSAASSSGTASTASNHIDPAQIEVISKTALWITNNADKASALIEKSRGNPTLDFLNDTTGATPAGKLYLKELQRYKTEKEVQSVCSGVQVAPVVHASQIANCIAMNKQTDFGAMMAASAHAAQIAPVPTTNNINLAASAAPPRERERKNRWGPSVESTQAAAPATLSATSTQASSHYAPSSVPATFATSSSSGKSNITMNQKDKYRAGDRHSSEAAQIAQLAANFDSSAQEDTDRIERLLREQKEMQLLESRIREAASQSIGAGAGNGSRDVTEVAKFLAQNADKNDTNNSSGQRGDADPYAVNLQARKGPALLIAEKQAALYLERLAQYQELAALDDDKYRDTVEDCERNNGVIEGGTWEHRKRAKEMLNTAAKNLELTLLGSGKHHMADYLPPDVLQSFLKNAESVKSGTASAAVDSQVNKIDESNVGFQLLKKSGWSEGAGLGAQSNGIVNPISALGGNVVMSAHSSSSSSVGGVGSEGGGSGSNSTGVVIAGGRGPEGAGIGVRATHEVTAEDSEFDQYRKRMMLAYRFRPNPMNNPRRDYY